MGDVSSGMASTVIQLYIKEILDAFLHYDVSVRRAALKVIQLILQQGLVHPVQVHFAKFWILIPNRRNKKAFT